MQKLFFKVFHLGKQAYHHSLDIYGNAFSDQ